MCSNFHFIGLIEDSPEALRGVCLTNPTLNGKIDIFTWLSINLVWPGCVPEQALESSQSSLRIPGHMPTGGARVREIQGQAAHMPQTCGLDPHMLRHPSLRLVQGCLAPKKAPTPPRNTLGPYAQAYCRVLGGGRFLVSEVPLYHHSAARRRKGKETKQEMQGIFHIPPSSELGAYKTVKASFWP